jgi:NTE family protein
MFHFKRGRSICVDTFAVVCYSALGEWVSEMNAEAGQGREAVEKQEPMKKVAFVLSGGANRGALEVGVLLALMEHGILPQILVGTSIGAINSAILAVNPTLEGARYLEKSWYEASEKVGVGRDYISAMWRLVTGRSSLYDSNKLRELIKSFLPEDIRQFSDIKAAELYITAVDIDSGELVVFGRDPSQSILDAIMASAAVPIFLVPWKYEGRQYVDGGVVSDLPMRVAVDASATELYAIDIGPLQFGKRTPRGILRVVGQTIDAVISHQLVNEYSWSDKLPRDAIHHIYLEAFENVRTWDFGHTAEMIAKGREIGLEHLRQHGQI